MLKHVCFETLREVNVVIPGLVLTPPVFNPVTHAVDRVYFALQGAKPIKLNLNKHGPQKWAPVIIAIHYCPFCGKRIDAESDYSEPKVNSFLKGVIDDLNKPDEKAGEQ